VFNPPVGEVVDCSSDLDRTKQSFKDECDINLIMKRAALTGVIDPLVLEQREAVFGEFEDGLDFMELQNRLVTCQRLFDVLPADVRSRFSNNPGLLVDFLAKPENRGEAERLGILAAERVEAVPAAAVPSVSAGSPRVVPPAVAGVPEVA